jgi:predicted CXXCH cytochrome family protein
MKKYVLLVVMVGLGLAFISTLAIGDVHTSAYKGSPVCAMCHKNTNKEIVDGYQSSPHAKAMQKADDKDAIVADFSANAPFTKDKVAFVLGVGRHEQAYMDADLKVLPAVWDVKAKAWKASDAADGATQCIGCHTTGYDPAKKTYLQAGVGCEMCHGPGSEHMMGDKKTTIVNPKSLSPQLQAMDCGQCHSAGKDNPSGKYAFPIGYRPGDDLTKVFADAKPMAAGRNQQYSEFIQSKHSKVGLSCVTCHDPHNTVGKPGQLKKPLPDLCLDCHAAKIKDMATHAPSAPEGATCATCHMPAGRHIFTKPGA